MLLYIVNINVIVNIFSKYLKFNKNFTDCSYIYSETYDKI